MTPLASTQAGDCECGCGGKAPIATATDTARGRVKGEPSRFIMGHHRRAQGALQRHRRLWDDAGVEYGCCLCGCGQRTPLATETQSHRHFIDGEPRRYLNLSHAVRGGPVEYTVEDRGYLTPCWIWHLSHDSNGYASGSQCRVHKRNYEHKFGAVASGHELDHLCRNRACVNPDHLEAVTHAENCRRGAKAKLTAAHAADIRETYARGGITQEALAARFGVTQVTISRVVNHRLWS